MLVIVLENTVPRLRGRLTLWMLEVRAGVYVGYVTARHRKRIWGRVCDEISESKQGNAVMIWSATNEARYRFDTFGENRRTPVESDGLQLISFLPPKDDAAKTEEEMLAWLNEMKNASDDMLWSGDEEEEED